MVATFKKNLYFCNVKSFGRYEAAATKQRFLYPYINVNSKRKECGSSNTRKVSADEYLTAPTALSFIV
jgi:hypothetical protein